MHTYAILWPGICALTLFTFTSKTIHQWFVHDDSCISFQKIIIYYQKENCVQECCIYIINKCWIILPLIRSWIILLHVRLEGFFFFYHRMLFWIAFEKKNHQYFQKSLFSRWVSALWNFDRRPYTLVLCLTHGKACQGYWRACIIMVHFSGDFNSDLVGCIINVQIEINILHKLGKLVFHHDSKQLHIVGFFSGRQSHSPRLGSHILAQQ